MPQRGLDGRARDNDGRIREKNGASKMGNLAKTYPELRVFTPDTTLSGVKKRHGVDSLEGLRKLAQDKLKTRDS